MSYRKKIFIVSILLFVIMACSFVAESCFNVGTVKDKIIRLHVLANSDTAIDQQLKLRVRDNVLNEFNHVFDEVLTKEDGEKIIVDNITKIREVARRTIKEEGFDYDVNVYYGSFYFPRKEYGDIVLPEGEYDAVRIEIGQARGQNWWCVMFPQLCFVNFGKDKEADVLDIKTEEKLSEVLSEDEIELIKIKRGVSNVKLKSKISEFIERGKIENSGLKATVESSMYKDVYAFSTSQQFGLGARGEDVEIIQTRLKDLGYYRGTIDAIYGQMTLEAVKDFQVDRGLNADGIVGEETLEALNLLDEITLVDENTAQTQIETVESYSPDIHLLAKVVYSEARGESYEGQVAVAAVVLNRVEHPNFPNSISEVVYQPNAFTAVQDGQIELSPDDTAYRAAIDAINGWDPTNGSHYYWNPKTATSKWIWSRTVEKKIGNHWFGN